MQGFFTNQEAPTEDFWEPEEESTGSTGFVENMQDSFGQMRREDLPIISRNLPNETTDMRMAQIEKYRKSGVLSDQEIEFYSSNLTFGPSLDIDALTMYMRNEKGLTDVATPQEYEVMRNEEYADYRKTADKTFKDQTLWGAVGEFAGMMGAMATDPVYASGLFFGYGGATTAVRAALYGAGIEMGTEIVAQPFIADWKDEIGVNYGASEMLVNVLAAGVFGGALAGGSKKIGMMISDPIDPQRMKVKDAVDRLFYGEGRGFATEPVLHALSKADPEESVLVAATRDEGITKTTNERGPRNVAEEEPVVIASKVDDIETEFDKTFAEVQAKMDEMDAAATKVEEGVTQRTPLSDAEQTVLDAGAPVEPVRPTKKSLRKYLNDKNRYERTLAKSEEEVLTGDAKLTADRQWLREQPATSGFMGRLDNLVEDLDNLAAGRPKVDRSPTPEELKWLKENPTTRQYMKTLEETEEMLKSMKAGTYTPKTKAEIEAKLEAGYKAVRAQAEELGILKKGVSQVTPSAVMPEITNPAARAHVAAAIDITDVIAKAEEAC